MGKHSLTLRPQVKQPIHASDERFIYRLGHRATHGYADVFIYHSKPVYFYRIYTGRCSPADPIKLPIYIFLAIFTKGPVGLIIPLLTIPAFLLVKKQFKTIGKYLDWKQWSILIGLCSLWFIAVYREGGKTYLNNLLFHQTINRAVDSFHHKEPFWYYLKTIWY